MWLGVRQQKPSGQSWERKWTKTTKLMTSAWTIFKHTLVSDIWCILTFSVKSKNVNVKKILRRPKFCLNSSFQSFNKSPNQKPTERPDGKRYMFLEQLGQWYSACLITERSRVWIQKSARLFSALYPLSSASLIQVPQEDATLLIFLQKYA